MAGPVEEAGKVAGGLIEALKAQPALLALIVANIGMMVFIFYALHSAATFRDTMLKQMFEESRQVNQLLAQCVPAGKTRAGPTLPLQQMGEKPGPVEDPPKPPVEEPSKPPPVKEPPKADGEGKQ